MATHLDLEEQEQLEQFRAFWKRYGNLITWLVIAALSAVAGWNGWNWYQRDQAIKASSMFEELDRAAAAGESQRVDSVFHDLKTRYPKVAYTQQAGLLAAKVQFDKGNVGEAITALTWVSENGKEMEYRVLARLRLAGIYVDQKKFNEALTELEKAASGASPEFLALIDDRRGDVFMAQDKKNDAVAAYRKAWDAMDAELEYRRLIEAKLTALAAAPAPSKAASGVAP